MNDRPALRPGDPQWRTPWTLAPAQWRRSDEPVGKAEDKRAAIIAQQAARQHEERPNAVPIGKRRTNWAATPPVKPRRGRPPGGSFRG